MALLILGKSECPLCAQVIASGQETVATTHFIQFQAHPLWRFSDSTMHYACFRQWNQRAEFVALYNSTIGQIVWGNGTRHQMAADGVIQSVPDSGAQERAAALNTLIKRRTPLLPKR